MQLSTPTSPDPNLLTLLFPAPAGGGVAAPDVPVALGAIVDFETLLASPAAPAPAIASPSVAVPMAPLMLDAGTSVIAPTLLTPETMPAIAANGTAPAPRAWPFGAVRPVNLSTGSAPEIAPDDTTLEAGEGEIVPTTVAPVRAVIPKIPEGEPRPVISRKAEREKSLLPDAIPVVVPVEITPVALAVGLPEQQRFGLEADLACAAGDNDSAETAVSIGLPPRSFPLAAPILGQEPKAASIAVRTASELEAPSEATAPKVPFHFARPMAVAFPADLTGPEMPAPTETPSPAAVALPVDMTANLETSPAVPVKAAATISRPQSSPAPVITDAVVPAMTSETEPVSGTVLAPSLSPALIPAERHTDDSTITPPEAAEFAVNFEANVAESSRREIARPRNFVSASAKQLTSRTPDLGTSVAKSDLAMPSASTLPRPPHAAFESASLLVEPVEWAQGGRVEGSGLVAADVPADVPPAPEAAASTAHRAVEAVLNAAQRFSSSDRHTVNLQFTVGGTDLNVRVELRADEVRATFRTDSPELRAALSHEWQAAAAQGDRSVRLAPPVFTGSDSSGFSASSGDHASQQHRQSAARAGDQFAFATSRTSAKSDPASPANSAVTPRLPLSTALHLHTLA